MSVAYGEMLLEHREIPGEPFSEGFGFLPDLFTVPLHGPGPLGDFGQQEDEKAALGLPVFPGMLDLL